MTELDEIKEKFAKQEVINKQIYLTLETLRDLGNTQTEAIQVLEEKLLNTTNKETNK